MVSSVAVFVALVLLISPALSFTPCPLLGLAYPPFRLDVNDTLISNSLKNLTAKFDQLVKTNTGPNGDISPNTTFSIALFSSNKGDSGNEPFFWQYHYTSPELSSAKNVTSSSVYRIGGLTQIFTVWSLLLIQGDRIFNDPITKYLPALAKASIKDTIISHTQWDEVTVGQLASHMSGISRDYCASDLVFEKGFSEAGLPGHSSLQLPCCANNTHCSPSDFIQHIAARIPVALTGMTPAYSNMAFQLLGYVIEKKSGMTFEEVIQHYILNPLEMNQTSIFAPKNPVHGVIPRNRVASGWSARTAGSEASTSMFSSARDLAIAGKAILNSTLLSSAQTRRWLKPVSHTSNPANSIGAPWIIYSGGDYPDTSMVDVYSILSNEGNNEGLYSSYLGLVPDYSVGFAILSADTVSPADLNAHADYMEVMLEAVMETALKQAAKNFGGAYVASGLNSSITVMWDGLPGLYIEDFVSNGINFRETLATLTHVANATDLSIRLYPTERVETDNQGSKQAFRGVLQDKTELADAGTPTCVSWMDLDKLRYGEYGLDEFIFNLNAEGQAVSVEIPALEMTLVKK
ncbi:hypothetical protein N7462_005761 [Penicillium macrosclerotiorum]|uniref:uncharacterized protein n=1 Tax=Penicillium macrosclerotiorum TaxID=303699 RepID=UPI0025499498|nr:uncharacterized protein N7462_005761 [Penicillium macrosclerotiorum]KAJ5682596.1 hypothetical protein N7462_005761 [Penicillium macrosclerotiorum]